MATIPAGLLGLLLEHALKSLFAAPQIVGAMLILNGVLLWSADMMRKNRTVESDISPFLQATPIIGAASVLKIPELLTRHAEALYLGPAIAGSLVAELGAYLSMRFLLRYFETQTLRPFAGYCIAAGVIASALLLQS